MSEVDMDELMKQHLQAKRAAMNPPAGFHDRLVARLDRSSPRKPFRALPQLAMALSVVMGVALLAIGISYVKSQRTGAPLRATPTVLPTASPSAQAYAGCLVPLPASWSQAISGGAIKTAPSDAPAAFAISRDGSRIFAGDAAKPWLGIVALDRAGHESRITSFLPGYDMVISGGFDGRWLLWAEANYHVERESTLRAWDSVSNRFLTLSTGVFEQVSVDHGKAAWINTVDRQLHLFDLASGTDRRLDASASYATFSWPMLIWAQGSTGDARLHAASALTGKPMALPAELSSIRDVHFIVGAPGRLAWSGAQTVTDVWFWSAGSQPRVVFRAQDYADVMGLGSTLVGAVGSSSDYLVDLRTGATTEVPNRVLGPLLNGDVLALTRSTSGVTDMSVPMTISVLSSSALPQLAGC
ncbi:MAG: hypothetical protein M3Z28_08865 [Candidatus Dormibacteraeota bacterium]|nr:hypothetical protein [Candidatus Dormibacteraeota bacterium]